MRIRIAILDISIPVLKTNACAFVHSVLMKQLIHVHIHVHNSILLLSPFLRLSLLSLFSFFFPYATVLYTYFPCIYVFVFKCSLC